MGIVHHQPGTFGPGFTGQRGQISQVAVHAEYAIGDHQGTAAGLFQAFGQTARIVMQVAVETRATEQAGIQQRGMVETVFKHRIALPHQGGDRADIGHIAIAEQQRPWTPGELGQGFFQFVMGSAVADDQMRRTTAYTPARGAGLPGFDHLRVIGQAQIVVIAEGEQRLAVDHHLRPLRALQQRALAIQIIGTANGQTGA